MDKGVFLGLCRGIAMWDRRGVFDICVDLPDKALVVYDGKEYYPVSLDVGYTKAGNVKLTAILHGINANHIVRAPLNLVERKDDGKTSKSEL